MADRPRPSGRARRVVLDANVLVPGSLRDTLLRAAEAGWYDPFWSATTLVEVERTLLTRLLRDHPERTERVARLVTAIQAAFPAATVDDDPATVAVMTNDPGDRHILAAAVQVDAAMIVTVNLRHFSVAALRPHRVVAQTPDRFLVRLLRQDQAGMLRLLRQQGADLRPPRMLAAVLETLALHAPGFVARARATLAAEPAEDASDVP
jgi:predicted nucleic acid-binding protein